MATFQLGDLKKALQDNPEFTKMVLSSYGYPPLFAAGSSRKPLTLWKRIARAIARQIYRARIWLGEKIAGQSFDDGY